MVSAVAAILGDQEILSRFTLSCVKLHNDRSNSTSERQSGWWNFGARCAPGFVVTCNHIQRRASTRVITEKVEALPGMSLPGLKSVKSKMRFARMRTSGASSSRMSAGGSGSVKSRVLQSTQSATLELSGFFENTDRSSRSSCRRPSRATVSRIESPQYDEVQT